jgi:hypothetical protein
MTSSIHLNSYKGNPAIHQHCPFCSREGSPSLLCLNVQDPFGVWLGFPFAGLCHMFSLVVKGD